MKKIYLAFATLLSAVAAAAQGPGLVISEFLANPPGTDNSFEWVELVATRTIDFSTTPYSVVVSNNGNGPVSGWINGGTLTYGFNITTGTVNAGDVVYVGGSSMLPTGTKLRVIDIATTNGDGFGNFSSAGVFGNGGGNADGIAVFDTDVFSLTSSTVPVDALFYGTGIGSAIANGGADGYQLPVNDYYNGGKLQAGSFFCADPGSGISLRASGSFNTVTGLWEGQRSFSVQTPDYDNATLIQLVTTAQPGTATISGGVSQSVSETAGTVDVNVSFSGANGLPAKIAFGLSVYTDATQGSDFDWVSDTLTIPANTNGTFPFTIQLMDDILAERTERIIVKMVGSVNATIGSNDFQIIYLTDDDYQAPAPSNELQMSLLNSFSNGAEGSSSAEIVAYDATTYRLYIANSVGGKMDIVDFANPSSPSLLNAIDVTPYGGINSIAVHNGVVAAALENADPQANGSVVFFDSDGAFINQVTVGAMPDMITYNNDYTKIVVACEGEPKTDYTVDPEGTIAIVDLTPGIAALTNANVTLANFNAYNGQETALRAQGIRIFGPGSSASQDFEPEYITISDDNTTAYVSLQENNAMAVVDLNTATVTDVRPLGLIDYSASSWLDASDQTSGIFIGSAPVKGAFMPDAIAHATIGGTEYIFSANEGDAREYSAITDVARISATSLDASVFPDQHILKHNQFLGRLNALQATGDTDNDGDKDEIHVLGGRSFSIWNAATGALVFDSQDLLEQITAAHPVLGGLFNASNSSGVAVMKNRSDDKGPEPEGVATAVIDGSHYLFVSLERVGGVMIFNVDNPAAPVYSGYYNNRSVATNGPDRGAEGIIYISKETSPNNQALVILANEVSSTLSIFQVNTCTELAGAVISATEDTICDGAAAVLSIPGDAQSTVQWLLDNNEITGETGNSINATQQGEYRVYVSNSALACADTTISTQIIVHTLPAVGAGADQSVCMGTSVTLSGSGAQTYAWNNSVTDGAAFEPAATMDYIVTGTDASGCENSDTVTVVVNALPAVDAGTDIDVCEGAFATLTGSGADVYAWNNGVTDGTAFTPASTADYIVTGTDANGCENSDTITVFVNGLPVVNAGSDQTVCEGESVMLTGSGAVSYSWDNGIVDGVAFAAVTTATYTVTGTDINGCEDTDDVTISVNAAPSAVATDNGNGTFTASAGTSYQWIHCSTGLPISGANGQTFTATINGNFAVVVTNASGCSDTSNCVTLSNVGIEEQHTVSMQAFPNPTSGKLNIVSSSEEAMTIMVSDLNGQLLLQENAGEIDLVNLAAGMYIVRVQQGTARRLFRVEKTY